MKPSVGQPCAQAETLAPLSQSRQCDMACEALYRFKHVRRETIAESEPAARGQKFTGFWPPTSIIW
jgi:hypothetical protein